VTGRRAIYAGSHACQIVTMPVEDGQWLLVDLHERALADEFLYTHAWREGDILMWDNRSVQHRQMPYQDDVMPRVLRRTTIVDAPALVGASA
jgi:alpha-ketoglutarate-dependent 2,4-dichlorophenoxyacetate dioxygenase